MNKYKNKKIKIGLLWADNKKRRVSNTVRMLCVVNHKVPVEVKNIGIFLHYKHINLN